MLFLAAELDSKSLRGKAEHNDDYGPVHLANDAIWNIHEKECFMQC